MTTGRRSTGWIYAALIAVAVVPLLAFALIARGSGSDPLPALAADTLQEMGYTNVAHLDGGLNAWRESGKPVEE